MEYGDVHRMFLQGIMSHNMLAETDALLMFSKIHEHVQGEECRSLKEMASAIKLINDHTSPVNQKVKKVTSEVTGGPYYVLVNTVQASIPSKVPRHAKAASQVEKEFLKAVLDAIVASPDGYISTVACLNLSNTLPTARITRTDADKLLERMVERKWFLEKSSTVCLSPRCQAEMEPYIRQALGDDADCTLCTSLILQGQTCVHCLSKFHRHCVSKYLARQPWRKCPKCPKCRGEWNDDALCSVATDDELMDDDD
ncbi:non-structural maintenance of chromosomes element 1 homolog isoform X2 [Bacillus rossius redtenbacheri]